MLKTKKTQWYQPYVYFEVAITFFLVHQDLMPIHCCAMQGRIDAIQALLFFDTEGSTRQNLELENQVFFLGRKHS